MALVMLPSDLPWWDSVKRQLKKLSSTSTTTEVIEGMQKIYEMCNVSLDPEDDTSDPQQFSQFLNFLENDLDNQERTNFLTKTLPTIVSHALRIKENRPKGGLHFSLQQQPDCTQLEYSFISSLLANAFFSSFPKRTNKSHPTLQNFNCSNLLKTLSTHSQKSKLRSLLYYFDWLENNENVGSMKILRQVMTSRDWLTIEDWLECNLPLCSLQIKHEGRLENSDLDSLHICFASAKVGGEVLGNGYSQESINFITSPELLTVLLNVEALEDNEVLTVERVRNICRIKDPKNKAIFEKIPNPATLTICCVDADDYTKLPVSQYEEDNILRELNKCLLAFQQKQISQEANQNCSRQRRLSPIGESTGKHNHIGSANSDPAIPLITQQSASTNKSERSSRSPVSEVNYSNRLQIQGELKKSQVPNEILVHNRRGRFIVLGSSGECLPVSRNPPVDTNSVYSSCESSEEEFHSANTSLSGGSEDENFHKRYSIDLETSETRKTFAQRLKSALRRDFSLTPSSSSEDSNYAVGISVTGSEVADRDIRVKRGGSTGFALQEDSLDEDFLQNSLQQERKWIDKFKNKQSGLIRKESSKSSEYSFSTDYSSELEEVYEQFSRWLDNPIIETEKGTKKELDGRELAVVRFAGSILKRTLSESFAGIQVPLTENCDTTSGHSEFATRKNKLVLNAKSLSLELARQKHRLAAQLSQKIHAAIEANDKPPIMHQVDCDALNKHNLTKMRRAWFISCVNEAIIQTLEEVTFNASLPKKDQLSQISQKSRNGLKPVSTGNWGCGKSKNGDPQLKVIIQWLAASVAGVPYLTYYTCGHEQLTKLDTVCRILVDRKWTVKDLAEATLRYANQVLQGREDICTLFEELIGIERST